MTAPVLFEKNNHVGVITLNRPQQLNALNTELLQALHEAVCACRDADIRAVVLHGAGRCFCAGGDIHYFHQCIVEKKPVSHAMVDAFHASVEAIRQLDKPVLASVHGAAAGGGAPLALACDLIIAANDAVFNFAYARLGLTPDGSSTYFLPRHLGLKKTFELFATMPTLTAQAALDSGLVNWIVPPDELATRTHAMASQLANGPTTALGRIKQLLNASPHNTLHDQLALETEMICASTTTADFREGVTAFLEKRAPIFRGC